MTNNSNLKYERMHKCYERKEGVKSGFTVNTYKPPVSRWFIIPYFKLLDKQGNNRDMIKIKKISENKKQFLDLLLLADEQEDMIDRYLPDGDLFALYDDDLKSVCVVLPIDSETCELKNIATYEKYQGRGYGRALINFISDFYRNNYETMLVGTGETPAILSFYESCGFEKSHYIRNFFTENYDHPMFEDGIQLVDMVYLKKKL